MHILDSLDQFETLLAAKNDFLVLKHSSRCSISNAACREVYQAIEELAIEQSYLVDVLASGNLKHVIAQKIGVAHESPQVLVFSDGKLVAHASHGSISSGWLHQILRGWHDTRKASV